ncbi:coiled-coil domain-containing protein 71 [Oncorhynchus tshawytscha]|uniref:Uncharacterized protein n=1 Tax=Oncorhynchus tshawytscha TaxID=74940 RepID=A0AAZ3PIP7_ONCTS|nr:coiled-coil domain-containing protein 71 [Oncorhynchus tshawytscha]XP_042159984.1 coiled-coil domain-containing protein 71 [Oncorhynchus tshawytscha]
MLQITEQMVYAMNCKEATEKVVQSWSRFNSAGQTTLLETLKAFSPMSKDLFDTEKELATFIEGLKDEGHKPTVLKSKDVYGYRSCTAVLRPVIKTQSTLDIAVSKVQKPGKKKGRKPHGKKTEINYSLLSAAAKVVLKNQPTIILTNLSKESLKQSVLSQPPTLAVVPVQMQSYIRLTNITGPSTGHTARLQFHTGVWSGEVTVPNSHRPLSLTGTQVQPSEGTGNLAKSVTLRRVNFLPCPVNIIGVPAILQNDRVLKECNGMPCWRDQKRKRTDEAEDKLCVKRPRNEVWLIKEQSEDLRLSENNLRFKVIKVDDSITDEEVRRKAQKILRVNLSPVIEIQPLIAYPV